MSKYGFSLLRQHPYRNIEHTRLSLLRKHPYRTIEHIWLQLVPAKRSVAVDVPRVPRVARRKAAVLGRERVDARQTGLLVNPVARPLQHDVLVALVFPKRGMHSTSYQYVYRDA